VPAAQSHTDPAAEVVRAVANPVRQRVLIPVRHESGDSISILRVAVVGQVGDKPVTRQKIQLKAAHPPPDIERPLIENDAARQQRIGEGGQGIEVGDVSIVCVEVVQPRFAAFTCKVV
jgi:hypothetical protein